MQMLHSTNACLICCEYTIHEVPPLNGSSRCFPFRCKVVIISVSECGSSVPYFPVIYMNNFKQQLCYNDNNVTTCWMKGAVAGAAWLI